MYEPFHEAIVNAQLQRLEERISRDGWTDTAVAQTGTFVYVTIRAPAPQVYDYRVRIDMRKFPVDPYWVGFIDPSVPKERWDDASDSDPRYWPWSPMAGLHGSFILSFEGPYRTFWCRECNFPFFVYHGDQRWNPAAWPLDKVVAHLRDAIARAESPSRWRPLQQAALLQVAANARISLPADAGLGAK